jgi:hypothetical protein
MTLGSPVNGTIDKVTAFNASQWNTSQYLFGYGPGIWNTTAVVSHRYFVPAVQQLRNFTVYGFINITAFDVAELYSYPIWANTYSRYFANVTDTFSQILMNASCNATFYDRTLPLGYNGSTSLYEGDTMFSLEGIVVYNVTCAKQFYNTNWDVDNASIQSVVNVTLAANVTELAAGVREVRFNVTNKQNYTENDIWVYHFVPSGFTVSYTNPAYDSQAIVGGEFTGNSTRWLIPNITAGASTLLRYNATGTANITALFQSALRVPTSNSTMVYSP